MADYVKPVIGTEQTVINIQETNVDNTSSGGTDMRIDLTSIVGPRQFVNLRCFGQGISDGGWSVNIETSDGTETDHGPFDGAANINDIVPVKLGYPTVPGGTTLKGPTKVIVIHTPVLEPQSSEDYR